MGKANLAKKKQWRRIPASIPAVPVHADFEAKAATSLPADQLFVLDKSGDHSLAKGYPDRFCTPKPGVTNAKSKGKPVKSDHSKEVAGEKEGVFDLWSTSESSKQKGDVRLSHIPAVIPPLPGQSYNPSSSALSQTWSQVLQEEEQKEREKQAFQEAIHGFKVVEKDTEILSDQEETPAQAFSKNPPTLNRKPTKKKMNKKVRWLLQESEKEREKSRKQLQKQVEMIPKLLAEEEEKQAKRDLEWQTELKRQREEKEAEAQGRKAPKLRMGQFVYQLPDTQAVYTEEQKPLRQMQPKATAVNAVYDSLVRRGKVDLSQPKRVPKMVTRAKLTGEKSREMHEARKQRQSQASSGTIPLPKA